MSQQFWLEEQADKNLEVSLTYSQPTSFTSDHAASIIHIIQNHSD